MMCVNYVNGRGEECDAPLYAEFTDENGKQWIVAGHHNGPHASHGFEVFARDEVMLAPYKHIGETGNEVHVGKDYPALPDQMAMLARREIERALKECGGNKTKAAEMLGLPSYQTLNNWIDKYT